MKADHGNDDKALSNVLKEWRADKSLPSHFQVAVWQRIKVSIATPRTCGLLMYWVSKLLPWSALAVCYVAILLTIGVTAGWTQAKQENSRVKENLSDRYVRMLNPYQAPR